MTQAGPAELERAVLQVPGVAGLHGGEHGTVATYLPGRRVRGLRVEEELAHVHLAVFEGYELVDVADAVRASVAGLLQRDPQTVVITIEDLVPQPPNAQESL